MTRNADLVIEEDEASDLLQTIEDELAGRWFGQSVRLVVTDSMPAELREWLAENLHVAPNSVYETSAPLGLADFEEFTHLDRGDLLYPPFTPRVPDEIRSARSITSAIREGDILLYHPYDSFCSGGGVRPRAAASDPDVLAIKQTLYRVGSNSPDSRGALGSARRADAGRRPRGTEGTLRRGAEHHLGAPAGGPGRTCRLRHRGPEDARQDLPRRPPRGGGLRRYVHLGTGNYNPSTARLYTDFSYFTDDPALGEDGTDLFNYLTGYSEQEEYQELLVAPLTMREKFVELVREQAARAEKGEPARISCKMNSLTDPKIIEELYLASQAGVKIELVIRGICCLKPGLEGISESIRVVSLVGRFLEHARVYAFGEGEDEKIYLGSADLMQRNLDRRVEQLFPLREARHRAESPPPPRSPALRRRQRLGDGLRRRLHPPPPARGRRTPG